ncbi:ROK family protein [Singulisphaera sp. PoT]|uniref:ROK family protein n=1 Tax=Singulisphaera sp. PoT TaxID=3411797 RepID=UPI003BF6146F
MIAEAPQAPFYLGIDLGGTNIKSGVVDDKGRVLSKISLQTLAGRGPEEGVKNLAEAGRQAVSASGLSWDQIAAVGLGSPGTIDFENGSIYLPSNLPGWANLPIRQRLQDLLGHPTVLQNDANAAAYGEFWAGAGRDVQSLVLFTLGTGIGCGIVDQGRIIAGRHGHGAECGHMIVQMDGGRPCSCGISGHLEAYASATSLVKRAVEALELGEASSLRDLHAQGSLTSHAISDAAYAGDPLAVRLMSETARYLAVGASTLMHTIDPDIVLFGGGMIAAGEPFLNAIREHVRKLSFATLADKTKIAFAELGGDAGFIGAAGCARDALIAREA